MLCCLLLVVVVLVVVVLVLVVVVVVGLSFVMVASLPPLHSKHLKNAAPLNIFDDFEAFMVPLSFALALFFYNVHGDRVSLFV